MLKLQHFGHLMWRTNSFEVWASSGSWWWTGKPGMLQSMGSQRVGHNWMTQLNWTVKLYLDPMSCVLSSLACPALCPPEMLSLILSVWWTLLYPSRWGMGYKWHVLCKTFLDRPTQSVSFSSILAATYLSCSYNQILLKVKYVYIVPFLCQMVCSITQSCLTLCNSMDCSPPGSSVHGIFQARILERVAISCSRGSSRLASLALADGLFTTAWPGKLCPRVGVL